MREGTICALQSQETVSDARGTLHQRRERSKHKGSEKVGQVERSERKKIRVTGKWKKK